ncbi:hypothetical protein D3C72_2399020 [compost metagenome]
MQLDGIGQSIWTSLIAIGQHINQFHVFIEAEQALIERFRYRLRQAVIGIVRIERGEIRSHGDYRIFRRPSRTATHSRQ